MDIAQGPGSVSVRTTCSKGQPLMPQYVLCAGYLLLQCLGILRKAVCVGGFLVGYQHMREGALLKGKATLSTAAFLLQVCVARGLGEVEGRCDRWRSNRERKAAVKIIQCLMCGRKGLDVFRCSGHSVQPFT